MIQSTLEEGKFWMLIVILVIFLGVFFSSLKQILPKNDETKETIEQIETNTFSAIYILIAGVGVIGTAGFVIWLLRIFGK